MEKVFPKNLDPVNKADVRGALSSLEEYTRYMRERIEFVVRVLSSSNSAVEQGLTGIESRLSDVEQDVADIQSDIGDIASILSQI